MAIITISRGSYSKGKEVAENVALRLGYTCISRDLLLEASEQFNIPEIKLIRALHDAPSVLERFSHGRERYLAYFAAAFLERVQKDNVVYHGLAGHFYLQGVSHVLNVRIVADMEQRIQHEMQREGISRDEAEHILKRDDQERRQWSLKLFGADPWDPGLYDLIINTRKISVGEAADIISHTVSLGYFEATLESQQNLSNLALAARVRAAMVKDYVHVKVTAQGGSVDLVAGDDLSSGKRAADTIQTLVEFARSVPGVEEVTVRSMDGDMVFTG
jgi:cytidylate kinase